MSQFNFLISGLYHQYFSQQQNFPLRDWVRAPQPAFVLLTCTYHEFPLAVSDPGALDMEPDLAAELPEIFRVPVVQGTAIKQLNNSEHEKAGLETTKFCLASISPFSLSVSWSLAPCNCYYGLYESHAFTVFCVYYFLKCTLWEEVQQNTIFSIQLWARWLPALQLFIVQERVEY